MASTSDRIVPSFNVANVKIIGSDKNTIILSAMNCSVAIWDSCRDRSHLVASDRYDSPKWEIEFGADGKLKSVTINNRDIPIDGVSVYISPIAGTIISTGGGNTERFEFPTRF